MSSESTKVNQISSTYDEFPYVSKSFSQTHPSFLKAACSLFDFETPAIETANILEIGCSFGGNIIPIARHFPKANIVGLDLSQKQISVGKTAIEAMGLNNIELDHQDISTYQVPAKKFDYIICHGVFSWVPEEVKEAIFQVIADGLSDNGVAIVSYNTYPGWKISEVYRDAMSYRSRPVDDMREKIKYGFGMLDFLKEHLPKESPWGVAIDQHYDHIRNADMSYLAHEYFEIFNSPCYFHQFMDLAHEKGLNFVCEADFQNHFFPPIALDDESYQALKREADGDIIKLEQLSDFLSNRKFRQTLLTRKTIKHTVELAGKQLRHDVLSELYIQGSFYKEEQDNQEAHWKSTQPSNGTSFKTLAVTDFIFNQLNLLEGKAIQVSDLWELAQSNGESFDKVAFFNTIAEIVLRRVVKIRSTSVQWQAGDTNKPRVEAVDRNLFEWIKQNPNTLSLSTALHDPIEHDVIADELVPILDGEHNIEDLQQHLIEAAAVGRVVFYDENQQVLSDAQKVSDAAEEHTQRLLRLLYNNGLLV